MGEGGGGVESTPSPYFICENNRKRKKIKHCVVAKELINPSTYGRRVAVRPPPTAPTLVYLFNADASIEENQQI